MRSNPHDKLPFGLYVAIVGTISILSGLWGTYAVASLSLALFVNYDQHGIPDSRALEVLFALSAITLGGFLGTLVWWAIHSRIRDHFKDL